MKYLVLILAILVVQLYCRQVTHKAKDVSSQQKGIVVSQKSQHSQVKVNSVTKRLLKSVVAVQAKNQGHKEKAVSKLQKISKARMSQRLKHKKKAIITKDVVLAEEICVSAVKDAALTFLPYLKEDLHGIQSMTLTHKSGEVACASGGKSKFGCAQDGYMIMATKNYKTIMFPDYTKKGKYEAVGSANKQQYKIEGKTEQDSFTVYVSDSTIKSTDLIGIWYTETYYKNTEGDNFGKTCFKLTAQVDEAVEQGNKAQLATQVVSDLCMKATGTAGINLTIPKDIKYVQAIQFNHRKGKVSCNGQTGGGSSNFGCIPQGYATLLMKDDKMVAPTTFDPAFKKESETNGKLLYYKLNGEVDSETFQLKLDESQTTMLTTDKYSVIYSEVAHQHTIGDNWGETCIDVFILNDLAKLTAEEKLAAEVAAKEASDAAAKKTADAAAEAQKLEEEAAKKTADAAVEAQKLVDEAAKKKLEDEAAKVKPDGAGAVKTEEDCSK